MLEDIKELLAFNGFENTKRQDYFNHEFGLILEDMHDENVIAGDNALFFIDTVYHMLIPYNFEKQINDTILKRGKNYYEQGMVIELRRFKSVSAVCIHLPFYCIYTGSITVIIIHLRNTYYRKLTKLVSLFDDPVADVVVGFGYSIY